MQSAQDRERGYEDFYDRGPPARAEELRVERCEIPGFFVVKGGTKSRWVLAAARLGWSF